MKGKMIKKITDFLIINLGLFLVAAGIALFKVPNHFATGGVSGIAIIIAKFIPGINVGQLMMIINIILLIVGFIMIGFDFGAKTVYSSFALAGMVWLIQWLVPLSKPITEDTFLELVYAIALPGIGSAIVFNLNSSTGGTDILAKILNKYTRLNIGKTLLIVDFIIAASATFFLGIKAGMYSILGLVIKSFLIDIVIESLNLSKRLEIITADPAIIEEYILKELKRGATVHKAIGVYSGIEKSVITVVVNRTQAIKLREYVHKVDSDAFVIISNTSEIIGRGFRNQGF